MADGLVTNSDEDESENCYQYELKGVLSKWTNYIHGWQRRYIVLKDGTLSYYKSEQETGFGCRGAIGLFKATIKGHEFDECRFDVSVNDCVWYLRADSPEDRQYWIDILEAFKAESGYGSEDSLKRRGSSGQLSLNSAATVSLSSSTSLKKDQILKEKLAEMETYKDILDNQVKTLQSYFDSRAETTDEIQAPGAAAELRGEALAFRETASAMLTGLQQCLDAMRELDADEARRRREQRRRRRCPDQEEGPHSTMNEDEFYDAVETGLDRMEAEEEMRRRMRRPEQPPPQRHRHHRLWPEIMRVTEEQIHYAKLGVGEVEKGGWQLFAQDGEMKMYRREEEVGGLVVDPLKACHVVRGVTGRELCHYFFSPQYRHEWEATVEQMTVLETIREDALVFHQVHKRVWPTSQRDALFWSHVTRVQDPQDRDAGSMWAVVNNSLSEVDAGEYRPSGGGKYVRIHLTVCLLCQTIVAPPSPPDAAPGPTQVPSRDQVTCKINYCSVVNPGGWVPATALRAVYKREYPKFLKRFTSYVIAQTKDKPILF